jgi:hypothetical protein
MKRILLFVSGAALLLQGCADSENSRNAWRAMAVGMAGAGNQPAYHSYPTYTPTY